MVMMTPDKVSCALRAGREKGQFNTLGESGRVAGGRVETLYFSSPPACGTRCGDRRGSVSGDRMGSVCGDHMGRFCGDRMGSVSVDRVGRLICYTESRGTR